MNIKAFFANKRFKYGAAAVSLTALILTAVILFNVGFSVLASRYNWYGDLTRSKVYNISEQSVQTLKTPPTDGAKVRVIFCADADRLAQSEYPYMVYKLAREYESKFSYIEIEHVNLVTEPDKVSYFLKNDKSVVLSDASVIFVRVITDGDGIEEYTMYFIYSMTSFFYLDSSSTYGNYNFIGEQKMTTAIYSLTFAGHPKALFVTNHGEQLGSLTNFNEILVAAGYDVGYIDLGQEAIPESDVPMLLIINGPKYDYSTEEIKKLTKAFDSGKINIFLFADKLGRLTNLFEFAENYGIVYTDYLLYDNANSLVGSGGAALFADYSGDYIEGSATESGETRRNIGSDFTAAVRSMSSAPKTVVNGARHMKLVERLSEGNINGLYPVLQAFPGAKMELSGVSLSASGSPLLVFAEKLNTASPFEHDFAYTGMLAGGSSDIISDAYLSGVYANRDIIFAALRGMAMGQFENTLSGLNFRMLDSQSLTISQKTARVWTGIIVTVLPLAVLATGITVYVKRKRR